jgi:hypothetical protein
VFSITVHEQNNIVYLITSGGILGEGLEVDSSRYNSLSLVKERRGQRGKRGKRGKKKESKI